MAPITMQMIRSRAEHNEGMLSTLEEVALHQQNIEKIELLGTLCRHLKIVYLQNNLIGKLQNLHKLKELEYLNMAVNNIVKIENLQRCESLTRLDLTVNFVDKAGLLSVHSLEANYHLADLFLLGNPCADWPGYRPYIVAALPQLKRLDGQDITPTERILANQQYLELKAKLREELIAEGIDPDKAAEVEDDGLFDEEIEEVGVQDENGEMVRPWCRETRILEHRESEKLRLEGEEKKKASTKKLFDEPAGNKKLTRRDDFPEIQEGERIWQKNEGDFDWSMKETEDGAALVLEVRVGKYMDTSLIKADVQPQYVRLLIKGRLFQLELGAEVFPDRSIATRSKATGALLMTMPKVDPKQLTIYGLGTGEGTEAPGIVSLSADGAKGKPAAKKNAGGNKKDDFVIKEAHKATLQMVDDLSLEDDDDYVPSL
eukprot:CAMPEP_0117686704 /NCGR_PEP_ID=MMETSP0804-20121206/22631_1 /TAXON_ID=1074897 /ORGANISM="Tetraselmis astigmatica, Strain CCMP880" /LENGTH=429 /DNA_ID=CAMNT_0005498493 /DNA_START=619 /DNA_END=1908 /DNA_ORIENTATION=+